ncbi:MAG: 50S ribosomal protein L13 [Methanomicrobiales archaeon]|nr:50S ribosomal protein L13 [Methanomicrobiales archaeon]
MVTVINAEDLILGRLASTVAKRALDGEEIALVNVEKAVISGTRKRVTVAYLQKRQRGSTEGGPFYPRRPDAIMKRTIRGMLPYKRQPGREALQRVRAYVGIPRQFRESEMETIEEAHVSRLSSPRYVTLESISSYLGAAF